MARVTIDEWLKAVAEAVPGQRPADSITADEVAVRTGYAVEYCRSILARNPDLVAVEFMTENRRRAKCYVRKVGGK